MKRLYFYILVLFFLMSYCAGPTKEARQKAEGHLKLGISYLNEGNLNAALKELLESEKLNPEDPLLHNALGLVYFAKNAYPQSEKHYKKAIEIKPDFSDAHNNLGVLYLNTDRYDEAILEFRAALSDMLYTTPERAYANIAWAYYKKKNYKEAEFNNKKAITIAPDFFIAHNNLGLVYYATGRFNEAVKSFKLAIKKYPQYTESHYHLGLCYIKLKKSDEALESFKEVCTLSPNSEYCEKSSKYIKVLQ